MLVAMSNYRHKNCKNLSASTVNKAIIAYKKLSKTAAKKIY